MTWTTNGNGLPTWGWKRANLVGRTEVWPWHFGKNTAGKEHEEDTPALSRLVPELIHSPLLHFTLLSGVRKEAPSVSSTGSICLVGKYFSSLWVRGQMPVLAPAKPFHPLRPRQEGQPAFHHWRVLNNYVNSADCPEIKMTWLKNLSMKTDDFEKINSGVATTHLKSSRKPQLALLYIITIFKTFNAGNTEQMLAEVAGRRAEEIKHLTEASGFLFQQIKSILLKAKGRKEKLAPTMPGKKKKKPVCLQWPGKLFKGAAFLSQDNQNGLRGRWGLARPSMGSSQCKLTPARNSCPPCTCVPRQTYKIRVTGLEREQEKSWVYCSGWQTLACGPATCFCK